MDFSFGGNIERRKFLRLTKKYPLRHARYVPAGVDDEVLESTTLNIGGGGLLFPSTERYAVGELLRLEIEIPGWQKFVPGGLPAGEARAAGPFTAKAIVTRVEAVTSVRYLVAASFAGLDRAELWALMFAINKK